MWVLLLADPVTSLSSCFHSAVLPHDFLCHKFPVTIRPMIMQMLTFCEAALPWSHQ